MEGQSLQQALQKYLENKTTAEEVRWLLAHFHTESEEELMQLIMKGFSIDQHDIQPGNPDQEVLNRVYSHLQQDLGFSGESSSLKRIRKIRNFAAIAASVALFAICGYFLLHKGPEQQVARVQHDVAPFSEKAILKIGHGSTIVLDNIGKGLLAQYSNTNIQKTKGDQIAYATRHAPTDSKVIYDTLQVPAGGRPYHLKLSDGSTIILNVASVLRYPENFRGNHNDVELISGEAYFSIVHNVKAPITVKAANQTIEDIGTAFNVNSYADEPDSRTTLVEGAVRINTKTLNPGQQAIITGNRLTIADANIMQTVAWKEGYFRFNGEHIQAVMRELSRWYNIEVKYEGKVADQGYYVKISRSKNISEVLKALERTNSVHFKIDGRRITVLSKK